MEGQPMNDAGQFRRRAFLGAALALLLVGGPGAGYWAKFGFAMPGATSHEADDHIPTSSDEDENEDRGLTVKVVKPKLNSKQLVRSVTQPAYVQPYYRADLMTRVSGAVKAVHKNIGD